MSQAHRTLALRALVFAVVSCLLVAGWREFLFLTDDAFITFRYIDHHRRGWGYVWNPPPFLPVEGYSNFLWMILLHAVWTLTGQDPPATANFISLLLSFGSLALAFFSSWDLRWPERLKPYRFAFSAGVLLLAVTNRTFLTWTSSGLETALFGFCTMVWVRGVLAANSQSELKWRVVMSAGAASAALTRPDGMLMVLATLLLLGVELLRGAGLKKTALGAAALITIPAHFLWRRSFYGEWLPNTYFAKHVRMWPDSGVRYIESFVLEHVLWTWLLLAAVVAALAWRRIEREGLPAGALRSWLGPVVLIGTFVGHVTYYVVIVGGDHFEYRILAQLILPLGIALVGLLIQLRTPPLVSLALMGVMIAAGIPIPLVQELHSRVLVTRAQTLQSSVPVADSFPKGPLKRYVAAFDRLQAWLLPHHVGTRHQEHKVFAEDQLATLPSRSDGEKIPWKERAVTAQKSVGVVGWVLPEVAIIDALGLNDWVTARNPVPDGGFRLMAHERTPPAGYLECFRSNIMIGLKTVSAQPRPVPLSDLEIAQCEDRFMDLALTWPKD